MTRGHDPRSPDRDGEQGAANTDQSIGNGLVGRGTGRGGSETVGHLLFRPPQRQKVKRCSGKAPPGSSVAANLVRPRLACKRVLPMSTFTKPDGSLTLTAPGGRSRAHARRRPCGFGRRPGTSDVTRPGPDLGRLHRPHRRRHPRLFRLRRRAHFRAADQRAVRAEGRGADAAGGRHPDDPALPAARAAGLHLAAGGRRSRSVRS